MDLGGLLWIYIWILAWDSKMVSGLDLATCLGDLGMQHGNIPDSALRASSYVEGMPPANARIRSDPSDGAWCPENPISEDAYEYLEIDFGSLKVVNLVETMGRFGNGKGTDFVERYKLDFQREDNSTWHRHRNRRGEELLFGNSNAHTGDMRTVDPPIIARMLRFVPYSTIPTRVCMRVEVYGCDWTDGTVSYDMPQGDRRGTEIDLIDSTYDGKLEDNMLTGGLGQLTDGTHGQSNFRLESKISKSKGYEWIGWRNDSQTKPIEIVFKFDAVRNFTQLIINVNNYFEKDVRVFRKAHIYFSVGGKYYQEEPEIFKFLRDNLMALEREVSINLTNRIGKWVKLELYFDSKWMLISEVQFKSVYAFGEYSVEPEPAIPPPKEGDSLVPGNHGGDGDEIYVIPETHTKKPGNNQQSNQGIASSEPSTESTVMDTKQRRPLGDEVIGGIIGALAILIIILFVVIGLMIMRHRKRKYNNNHHTMKSIEPGHVTLDMNDIEAVCGTLASNGKLLNGNMYKGVATSDDSDRDVASCCNNGDLYGCYGRGQEESAPIQNRKLPELPPTPGSTDTNSTCRGGDYAVPDLSTFLGNVHNGPLLAPTSTGPPVYQPNIYHPPPTIQNIPADGSPYACSDVINLPSIQGVSGNTVYGVSGVANNLEPPVNWIDELSITEFPRENLKFIEKLGEGQFGEVHLCEAHDVTDSMAGDDFLTNRTSAKSMLVAVKTLRRNVEETARGDFNKEIRIMARLKDPNIVRVLGICTNEEPLLVIVEYMKFGDLNQFLQQHMFEGTMATRKRGVKILSYGSLVYMVTQIASGMKYLESLNMVHRDLATRNCLVGEYYTIKISDFGMSRSLYSSDYYRIEGRAVLPIRWMAWESILLGKFTTKSDVWSFGVTLWEVLTLCRQQPFEDLNDEQVIENCAHFYRNDGLAQFLPQPLCCPREIFDLMYECWNRDESSRPAFREIHMFLQRKTIGYSPKEDQMAMTMPAPHHGTSALV